MACGSAVVKLGGSVITVKDEPYTIDVEALDKVASTLSRFHKHGLRLALVHGGGSFGHTAAREAMERRGGRLHAVDVPRIQEAMLRLGVMVSSTLLRHGVPATLHPAHTLCNSTPCSMEPMVRDLGEGLMPVTYGDAIPVEGGGLIVSGDDLAVWLASALRPDCLVYVTSTPGVLDPEGEVIEVIGGVEEFVDVGGRGDVTGGMRRKVLAALEAARYVGIVRIVGLDGLEVVLGGGSAGTLVRPARRLS